MFYTRGSSSDFDRFASVTGDPGWSWNGLQPYFKKVGYLLPRAWSCMSDSNPRRQKNSKIQLTTTTLMDNLIQKFTDFLAKWPSHSQVYSIPQLIRRHCKRLSSWVKIFSSTWI